MGNGGMLNIGVTPRQASVVRATYLPRSFSEETITRILEGLFPGRGCLPYDAKRSRLCKGGAVMVAMVHHPDPASGTKKLIPKLLGVLAAECSQLSLSLGISVSCQRELPCLTS